MDAKSQFGTPDYRREEAAYLRHELGDILPEALATLVELRPADPISMLAFLLHKYRELHPKPETELSSSVSTASSVSYDMPPNTTASKILAVPYLQPLPKCSALDSSDSGDMIEDSGWEPFKMDNIVHREATKTLAAFGDLFDDDDVE